MNFILCSAYFQYSALYGSCADNKTTGGRFNIEYGPERKLFCIAVYAPGSLCCDFIDGYIFIQRGTGGICIKCCILLQSHFYGAVSAIGIKRVFIGIVPTAQYAVMGAV